MIAKFIKKDRFPFLILFLIFLAYGLFIPFQGFYWDDFPYMWFRHNTGIAGVIRAIAMDRPILGIFYALPMAVLGESPWVWQIFAILCRFIFILSVFGFLNRVFPDRRTENKYLILLFSVFPGFTQQWISVIYSHAFLIFALYFYGLSLFTDFIRKDGAKWFMAIPPISLTLVSLFATEYMAGLEVLKLFIIFKIITDKNPELTFSKRLSKTFFKWMPFLGATLIFILYRVFIASSVLYKVENLAPLTSGPIETIINLIYVQFLNIYTATILAWSQIFNSIFVIDFSSLFSKVYLAVLVFTFFISFVLTKKYRPLVTEDSPKNRKWVAELFIGSFIILLFVGIPFWAGNLRADIHFPNDRVLIPFMLGSSALMFLLICVTVGKKIIFSVFFSIVISLSVGQQVFQANSYRTEWDYFKQFFAQISWRIPSLEENTILVADELPLHYYSDNSLTAAFNWIYSKENDNSNLPYLIYYTKARFGITQPSFPPHTEINTSFRTYTFKGSTDQLILFYHDPPGCVHIADPDIDTANPLISKDIRPFASLSNLDLIKEEENKNTVFFLEDMPGQSWCYYYQKASLAVQNQDWEGAARLGDIAFNLNDYPNDASERLPFIEAYAMTGDLERAVELSNQTLQVSALYEPMVCNLWDKIFENAISVHIQSNPEVQELLSVRCAFRYLAE